MLTAGVVNVPVNGDEALIQEDPNHPEVCPDVKVNDSELTVVQDHDPVEVGLGSPEGVGVGVGT